MYGDIIRHRNTRNPGKNTDSQTVLQIIRIYIGHIPENGALALTGVGVCMPLIMIVSAFAALVGNGGAPRASIFMGKGDKSLLNALLATVYHTDHRIPFADHHPFTGNRSFLMALVPVKIPFPTLLPI